MKPRHKVHPWHALLGLVVWLLFALLLAIAGGCARMPGLYAELGAGVVIDRQSSYILRPECFAVVVDGGLRSCGGDNPAARFSVGYEFRRPWRCEFFHWSHYFDGGADREAYLGEIDCLRRFGGR